MAGRIIVFTTLVSLLVVGTTAAESKSFELLKLDLHCPRNDATLKPGWAGWRVPGGCDGDAQMVRAFLFRRPSHHSSIVSYISETNGRAHLLGQVI